jgi:PAS domain S-box-containing protein
MARPIVTPTGVERFFPESDLIVSKTDTRGIITYANKLFVEIADYSLPEVIGSPHNMVRNPQMPRCVFKLLWDRINDGKELFAYVVNSAKNGDHYWVLAHVTPSFDEHGRVVGYHSNRRTPRRDAVSAIQSIYRQLISKESEHHSPKEGIAAGEAVLNQFLQQKGVDYDRFIHSL